MDKLSVQEYQKLVGILKENSDHLAIPLEEKAADIIESICFEAKIKNSDIRKAKVNLIDTPNGPEIGVTFE
ncbi:hypothetical protein [Methanobacterium sp.]|uniref:hypothetical protein n=1 Tax=Methanobacterium sp. TaxID=2164 RepID=UPI003C7639B1